MSAKSTPTPFVPRWVRVGISAGKLGLKFGKGGKGGDGQASPSTGSGGGSGGSNKGGSNKAGDKDGNEGGGAGKEKPKWPDSPDKMDDFLGMKGRDIPDGPGTPGRNKRVWQPNSDTKITYEQHPYHPDAPDWHKGPHWHLDTPGDGHQRFLPGQDIPGFLNKEFE